MCWHLEFCDDSCLDVHACVYMCVVPRREALIYCDKLMNVLQYRYLHSIFFTKVYIVL